MLVRLPSYGWIGRPFLVVSGKTGYLGSRAEYALMLYHSQQSRRKKNIWPVTNIQCIPEQAWDVILAREVVVMLFHCVVCISLILVRERERVSSPTN